MLTQHLALQRMLDAHWVLHAAWPHPDPGHYPHCTPLYYARLQTGKVCAKHPPASPLLIFVSDPQSEHGQRQQEIARIGASIALESTDVAKLRGATLRGEVRHQSKLPLAWVERAKTDYLQRHPQAKARLSSASSRADFYLFALAWAKLTDNEKGFGAHPIVAYNEDLWAQLRAAPPDCSNTSPSVG